MTSSNFEAGRIATYLHTLQETCNIISPRDLGDGRWAGVIGYLFTHAIVVGKIGDLNSYDDRWCYHDSDSAKAALEAWDGSGEPEGWHRHPLTGRRRENGDAEAEYLAP